MRKYLKLSIVVFAALFLFGIYVSKKKPVGNDEIFSLIASVQNISYGQIIFGQVPEGNICPLFYLLEKAWCDIFNYTVPAIWEKGADYWGNRDSYSEVFLRLQSNLFISLSGAMIFYYFFRYYGLIWGGYSLALFFSSFVVWFYIAEARHYALWFLLTTWQALVYLHLIKSETVDKQKLYGQLGLINLLLSITVIFSVIQIAITSFLLWVLSPKERRLRIHVGLTLVPLMIALTYYAFSPHFYKYLVHSNYMALIYSCFPKILIQCILAYGIIYGINLKLIQPHKRLVMEGGRVFLYCLLILTAAFLLLMVFKINSQKDESFHLIAGRYFIFITPIGIIALTYLMNDLFKAVLQWTWMRINLIIFLVGVLLLTYIDNHMMWQYIGLIK